MTWRAAGGTAWFAVAWCAGVSACGGGAFSSVTDEVDAQSDGASGLLTDAGLVYAADGAVYGPGPQPGGSGSGGGGGGGGGSSSGGPGGGEGGSSSGSSSGPGPGGGNGGCDGGAQIICNGKCVSALDPAHCGNCQTQCAAPPSNGSATCSGTPPACGISCATGYHVCQGSCLSDNDDPAVDPCEASDSLGVFVSPMGHAGAAGTHADPLNSIGSAMQKAAGALGRVFVCAGTYDERLSVGSSRDGLKVYGGLDCASWAYSASTKVKVAPSSAGAVLAISNLSLGLTLEDVELDAADGVNPGDSSVAASVSGSQAVVFRRVVMVGGRGQAGQAGQTQYNYSYTQGAPGNSTSTHYGAAATQCECPSLGGQGGNGDVSSPSSGQVGQPEEPGSGAPNDGLGGSGGATCSSGHNGAVGPWAGGGAGAMAAGTISSVGWSATPGSGGGFGQPGQGGGGGGGGLESKQSDGGHQNTGGGGSGGCGGCGGGAGTGGQGGGASIGLLSFGSSVELDSCQATATSGGAGGNGGDGQPAQLGGPGGSAAPGGCAGGTGGQGGDGGGGGGGAGGIAVGVAYTGTMPVLNMTTTNGGTAGNGGAPGNGGGATSGISGVSAGVQSF